MDEDDLKRLATLVVDEMERRQAALALTLLTAAKTTFPPQVPYYHPQPSVLPYNGWPPGTVVCQA